MRYARAPSSALAKLLQAPAGLLSPLLKPCRVAGLPLDLQLREKDQVMLYCGLTCLLVAKPRGDEVVVTAHRTYRAQACGRGLFRRWRQGEGAFPAALAGYLAGVEVGARHTGKEGAVQSAWLQTRTPWLSLDREAVIGGGLTRSQAVDDATATIRTKHPKWAKLDPPKAANELDQLGIAPDGALVLNELKHGSANTVYYAPLQALRYATEWADAVGPLLPELQALADAKVDLGLLPRSTPRLSGVLRVAIGWGEVQPSPERMRRLDLVLEDVRPFLPPSVQEIEVWTLRGGATRLR